MVGQHNSRARLRSLCGQLRFTAAEATILCFPPGRHRRRTTPAQRADNMGTHLQGRWAGQTDRMVWLNKQTSNILEGTRGPLYTIGRSSLPAADTLREGDKEKSKS